MKKAIFLSATSMVIALSSCQKEPMACFESSASTATVGQTVNFTNCTMDGHHYMWNFGDGGMAETENASHAYSSPGTYKVTLEAMSKNGKKSDEVSKTITVQ
jgi:PKD repeat protein